MDFMGLWYTQKGNELKDFGFMPSTKISSIMELSVLITTQSYTNTDRKTCKS